MLCCAQGFGEQVSFLLGDSGYIAEGEIQMRTCESQRLEEIFQKKGRVAWLVEWLMASKGEVGREVGI
jgi:hypothetical protein